MVAATRKRVSIGDARAKPGSRSPAASRNRSPRCPTRCSPPTTASSPVSPTGSSTRAATALLFSIGKYLIGLYLGKAAVGSAYGAAGAFVILLVWVYYSTQIVLFGAEITYVYAKRFGHGFGDAPAPLAGTELQTAV